MPANSTSTKVSQLEHRIAGRLMARELYQLYEGPVTDFNYVEAFIDEFSKLLGYNKTKNIGAKEKVPIARLGRQTLGYGEFGAKCLDDIPVERLDWYLRKAEETVKLLESYLNHPELKSRRPHESIS